MKYTKVYKKPYNRKKMNKPNTITKLAKQVNLLKKISYETQYLTRSSLVDLSRDYNAINLMNVAGCTGCFGSTAEDLDGVNKAYWKSCDIDLIVNKGNEPGNVDCTIFLVQLKPEMSTAVDIFGNLALTTQLHYVRNNATTNAGQTLISPKAFNIIKSKRIYIGSNQNDVNTNGEGVYIQKRFRWTMYPKKMVKNPIGNFNAMYRSQDIAQNYYILIFNNNLTLDSEFPTAELTFINGFSVAT